MEMIEFGSGRFGHRKFRNWLMGGFVECGFKSGACNRRYLQLWSVAG
jgi:hypothetical protein